MRGVSLYLQIPPTTSRIIKRHRAEISSSGTGALEVLNCASPAYLEAYGTPQSLDALSGHRLIHYASSFGGPEDGWEYRDEDGRYRSLPMAGALAVNSAEAYQEACLAGMGLIQAPASGLRALLDRGDLVEVLPQYRAEPMPVTLLYPQRRHLP